ncbi:hypothetical protein M9H77_04621 [Catharanthus roseus]|uniref:Uncharacterized protein n=1 Tax=Catharanthus roseus TaxID=4058 RepID=A0ACC0CEJ3_CATRO|nr:hypothetical protein M9H77_04621 [Catharanthus roseus]
MDAPIYLCQWKYALDFLSDTGFLGAKPLSFPMEQDHNLGKAKVMHQPVRLIEMLPSASFTTSKVLPAKVFFFAQTLTYNSELTVSRIRLIVPSPSILSRVSLFL